MGTASSSHRGAQGEQGGRGEQLQPGPRLDVPSGQPARERDRRGVRVPGHEHLDDDHIGHQSERDQQRPPPELAAQQQVAADRGHGQRQVLLHQHQRQRPQGRRPPPLADQRGRTQSQQRHREADLVEVEPDRRLQPARQAVPHPDRRAGPAAEPVEGEPGHRDDRPGEQRRLRDQQRPRVREHPVDRGEHGQDRVEVVGEQVEAGPLQVGHRRTEPRVPPYGLLEDAQVVAGGAQLEVPGHGQRGVQDEEDGGEQVRHRAIIETRR